MKKMDDNLIKMIIHDTPWDIKSVKQLSPLQLAYIGDAVYELLVRTYLLKEKNVSVNNLHREAIKYVKAKAQAQLIHYLENKLTHGEQSMVKRGRNSKSASVPKNASLIDYKYATGFETLIGFLYLTGNSDRLSELFKEMIEAVDHGVLKD